MGEHDANTLLASGSGFDYALQDATERMMLFATSNGRFSTNTNLGSSHGNRSLQRGNALADYVRDDGENTLWLEHVYDIENSSNRLFWFVWYDRDGRSLTSNLSGVFEADDLRKAARELRDAV